MAALDRIANEMKCRVILSTHSRHVVEARPAGAEVVWIKNGGVVDRVEGDAIPALMDIGALDRLDLKADVVLATEDKDSAMLRTAIPRGKGVPRIDVVELNGVNNATMAEAFGIIASRVKHGPAIVMHRDRDFLTADELQNWSKPFEDQGVRVFATQLCDVESYFGTAEHLAEVTGMTFEEATNFRRGVIEANLDGLRGRFEAKRAFANSRFWPSGGSPLSEDLWPPATPPKEEHILGKDLLRFLKIALKADPTYRSVAARLDTTPSKRLRAELSDFLRPKVLK